MEDKYRTDSRLALSQWDTSLQSNDVSYWLGANLESTLRYDGGYDYGDDHEHFITFATTELQYIKKNALWNVGHR